MEEDTVTLPLSPLLAALQEVRNTYQPRPKLPMVSDHTTKEKMRRERIKDSCDQLRVLLPYIRGRKTDMASVLEMCVDYLRIVNIALPAEFKSEVADILGKDCQVTIGKGREQKSTPRKRKRDLSKPPESPLVSSSVDASPMYTPPATPGSETGSESVASPLSFNMNVDQGAASSPEPCFVKLETTVYETSVTAPKSVLPQSSRSRSNKTQQLPHRNTGNFVSAGQNDVYSVHKVEDVKAPNLPASRGLDYFSSQRNRLPGCYSFSVFNRSNDIPLPPPTTFFPSNIGTNMMMADKDLFRSCLEMDDPLNRYSTHPSVSLTGGSGLSIDPLVSYVNPNAVLPVSYPTRFPAPNQTIDHSGSTDSSVKSDM